MDDDRRARLRAQLRAHHPDVGGDPDRFQETLAAYRALSPPSTADARDYRGEVRFAARGRTAHKVLRACVHPLRALAQRRNAPPRVH
jgi:hypothetical protein